MKHSPTKLIETEARGEMWSGGVDWIGVTTDDHAAWRMICLAFEHHRKEMLRIGAETKPAAQNGYYGTRTEHAFWGRRDDGCIAQATSSLADALFYCLSGVATRVPRLDVQVTYWGGQDVGTYLNTLHEEANAWNETRQKPLYLKATVASRRVETIYIGSPASDQRGRIYDKFAESKEAHYKGAVRFEVQLRNERAMAAAQYLQKGSQKALKSLALVQGWYSQRGIPFPVVGSLEPQKLVLRKTSKSLAKTLGWLTTEVSSAILRMTEEAGALTTAEAVTRAFRKDPHGMQLLQWFADAVGNYTKLEVTEWHSPSSK